MPVYRNVPEKSVSGPGGDRDYRAGDVVGVDGDHRGTSDFWVRQGHPGPRAPVPVFIIVLIKEQATVSTMPFPGCCIRLGRPEAHSMGAQ